MAKKTGLGRGLDSLFSENSADTKDSVEIRLSEIEPNRDQPRKYFDEAALEELSESIKAHGLIQPLLVRPLLDGRYQIVAGERRWRASRLAGLTSVPVVIRELDDKQTMEIALIENLQREDLNPIEEAKGYKQLMDTHGFTQEQVSISVNKSRPAIANALRLLNLTETEMEALESGKITQGHARTLLSIEDKATRELALEMAKNGCSVRELEKISQKSKGQSAPKKQKQRNKLYDEVEIALTKEVGRRIKVNGNGVSGVITIEFFNDEDLCEMAERIGGK